jgi:hypothetical protein
MQRRKGKRHVPDPARNTAQITSFAVLFVLFVLLFLLAECCHKNDFLPAPFPNNGKYRRARGERHCCRPECIKMQESYYFCPVCTRPALLAVTGEMHFLNGGIADRPAALRRDGKLVRFIIVVLRSSS